MSKASETRKANQEKATEIGRQLREMEGWRRNARILGGVKVTGYGAEVWGMLEQHKGDQAWETLVMMMSEALLEYKRAHATVEQYLGSLQGECKRESGRPVTDEHWSDLNMVQVYAERALAARAELRHASETIQKLEAALGCFVTWRHSEAINRRADYLRTHKVATDATGAFAIYEEHEGTWWHRAAYATEYDAWAALMAEASLAAETVPAEA